MPRATVTKDRQENSSDINPLHAPEAADDLRSFGRRRGRTPSPKQQDLLDRLLPGLELDLGNPPPADLRALFHGGVINLAIEIGFGGGEHLLWQARNAPATGFIGCEPFEDGVIKVLSGIEETGLENIRLHVDDARDVLRWLPPASLDAAYVLFPDPWPKVRHRKRRLVNPITLNLLARVMKPGARLRLATDIADYARTILIALNKVDAFAWTVERPADWRDRPSDWPQTRYEQKALREGRRCYFFTLRRRH